MSDITNWLALTDQDQIWIDGEGREHQIDDMDPAYCRRVLAWLHSHADDVTEEAAAVIDRAPLPDVHTVAYDVVAFSSETAAMRDDPHAWLVTTPLITSLRVRAGWLTTDPKDTHR